MFLDYVAGQKSEDAFVRKLENAVSEAKKNREWSDQDMVLYTWMKSIYQRMGLSDGEISKMIQEEHGLIEDEVDSYLIQSAKSMLKYIKNEIGLSENELVDCEISQKV